MAIIFHICKVNSTFPNSAPAVAINPLTVKIANDFSFKTAIPEIGASSFSLLKKIMDGLRSTSIKHFGALPKQL
jgi:hypothetical protein